MSAQASQAAESHINAKPEIVRRTANFHPSVWGDRFDNYEADDTITHAMQKQVEELKVVVRREVFTNAVLTFLDVLNEVEEELIKQGRSYRVYYAKEIMKNQARLYFAEARWFHEACTPTMDEYVSVAAASVGNTMLSVISLVGMGDNITKEANEWMANDPKILRASNIIFRLMDDIAGHKFEKERGHVASSIDCYMKQYVVSEEETIDVFNKRIVDSWKDINEEFLKRPTHVPKPVLNSVLNLTRVVDLIYKRGDAFTHVGKLMKDCVGLLLIDPVPL
ncbi:hypothetical protein M0R45_029882 [Rubus argutus]|uniref:Terpene synthase metal-binding domain-containing protein n=1 Tax=Rubus argutus TaxID=59490 RepID=A0AAW1WBV3_RUBAR